MWKPSRWAGLAGLPYKGRIQGGPTGSSRTRFATIDYLLWKFKFFSLIHTNFGGDLSYAMCNFPADEKQSCFGDIHNITASKKKREKVFTDVMVGRIPFDIRCLLVASSSGVTTAYPPPARTVMLFPRVDHLQGILSKYPNARHQMNSLRMPKKYLLSALFLPSLKKSTMGSWKC